MCLLHNVIEYLCVCVCIHIVCALESTEVDPSKLSPCAVRCSTVWTAYAVASNNGNVSPHHQSRLF